MGISWLMHTVAACRVSRLEHLFSSPHRKAVHHFSRRRWRCKAGQLLIYLGAETPGMNIFFSVYIVRLCCTSLVYMGAGTPDLNICSFYTGKAGHHFGLQRCRSSRADHLFPSTHSIRLGNPLVYSTQVQGLRLNICSHQHTRLYSKAGVHHWVYTGAGTPRLNIWYTR
jgi:hypothetical protein